MFIRSAALALFLSKALNYFEGASSVSGSYPAMSTRNFDFTSVRCYLTIAGSACSFFMATTPGLATCTFFSPWISRDLCIISLCACSSSRWLAHCSVVCLGDLWGDLLGDVLTAGLCCGPLLFDWAYWAINTSFWFLIFIKILDYNWL